VAVTSAVLLCSDGSELALSALSRGLPLLAPADRIVVATVVDVVHAMDVVGTGMAGGVISPDVAERMDAEQTEAGRRTLEATCDRLGLTDAETVVLVGGAGPALCNLAATLPAEVMVVGTRGMGGLRRAVLGSVSDHIVRNAPCPVLVSSAE
jgi:nucleotide-binding universal stress UspA family protein